MNFAFNHPVQMNGMNGANGPNVVPHVVRENRVNTGHVKVLTAREKT